LAAIWSFGSSKARITRNTDLVLFCIIVSVSWSTSWFKLWLIWRWWLNDRKAARRDARTKPKVASESNVRSRT
jgi:hypothetical protein